MNNYHTHTFRCQHAKGDVDEYVQQARKKNLKVLGISDHTALPDHRWPRVRMRMDELDDYDNAIEKARADYDDILILKAMECEYDKSYPEFYCSELLGKRNFDYLIGSVHYFPYEDNTWVPLFSGAKPHHLKAYVDHFILTMQAGVFTFMAHPDAFGLFVQEWTEEVEIEAHRLLSHAESLKMVLEINSYGFCKKAIPTSSGFRSPYPWMPFWELVKQYSIQVIPNADAHLPKDVDRGMKEVIAIAQNLKLDMISHDQFTERYKSIKKEHLN